MQIDEDKVRRWQSIIETKPTHLPALIGLAKSLAAEGKSDEIMQMVRNLEASAPEVADQLLTFVIRFLPDDTALGLHYCQLGETLGKANVATARWMMLCARQPSNLEAQLGYVDNLMRDRPAVNAEKVALTAAEIHPENLQLREALARIAEKKHDWEAAVDRWADVLERNPDHPEAAARQRTAEQQIRPASALALDLQPAMLSNEPVPKTSKTDAEIKELLLGFESLGCDCEFGLLQRRFGGEPLGLLRFAGTFPRAVLVLLRSRFAGIGDPEKMTVKVTPKEYTMRHLDSGWGMHTKIKPTKDTSVEKVLKDQCRHTSFLRKKIISELDHQSKIFVFQRHNLTDKEINAIYHATQEYGPNWLLCVRLADARHPVGSIEWRTDRLMIAAIDRNGRMGLGWDISVDYWVHFCRIARARHDEMMVAA